MAHSITIKYEGKGGVPLISKSFEKHLHSFLKFNNVEFEEVREILLKYNNSPQARAIIILNNNKRKSCYLTLDWKQIRQELKEA